MVPLIPVWLKVAVTLRVAEDGGRRVNSCKTRIRGRMSLSLSDIVTCSGQL